MSETASPLLSLCAELDILLTEEKRLLEQSDMPALERLLTQKNLLISHLQKSLQAERHGLEYSDEQKALLKTITQHNQRNGVLVSALLHQTTHWLRLLTGAGVEPTYGRHMAPETEALRRPLDQI